MQKLEERNTYIPLGASLAQSSMAISLNREETLSEYGLKTFSNIHEVNLPQHTEGRNLRVSVGVYVLNIRGLPLMPTSPRKAKQLLKKGDAKVVTRSPFTIQLLKATGETKQDINLGIDSGYKNIGFSAISNKQELISGEVYLDNKMSKRLDDRRMYRKNKRGRLWHRKPRFSNRSNNKKESWLPPSIERRYQTHLSVISKIKRFLPISDVIVEVGSFDIQKLNDPTIQEIGYQQGTTYQCKNRIAYLIARERGICQYCNEGYKKGDGWRLHHIWGKQKDRPEDWALLHKSCHIKLHKLKEEGILRKKKNRSYKGSTFMNIIKGRFIQDIDCRLTFGYKTFVDRCNLGIEKSHVNDAFVIAGGKEQERTVSFKIMQHRKNNRSLQKNRKGFAPSIRRQRYSIQPSDLVKVEGKWCETKGTHCKGLRIIIDKRSINIKIIERVFHVGTLIWRAAISPIPERKELYAAVE